MKGAIGLPLLPHRLDRISQTTQESVKVLLVNQHPLARVCAFTRWLRFCDDQVAFASLVLLDIKEVVPFACSDPFVEQSASVFPFHRFSPSRTFLLRLRLTSTSL
jgi:hypothetical protein